MIDRYRDLLALTESEREEIFLTLTGPINNISPRAEAFIRTYHITYIVNFRYTV